MARLAATFVGRERELDVLGLMLEEAVSGRGGVAFLVGEPGIGKTRTAQEAAALGATEGFSVLRGAAYDALSRPHAIWGDAVLSDLAELERHEVIARLGERAELLAELVPQLRELLPDGVQAARLRPQEARLRAYDAVARFLLERPAPALVLLDDLHWADHSSLGLLRYVTRFVDDARLLIVGTYRESEVDLRHPLHPTVAEIARHARCEHLVLGELDKHEARELVESAYGGAVTDDVAAHVRREAGGNPFFLTELGRQLRDAGVSDRIPDSVQHAIGDRLARLSSPASRLLSTASAFADPFGLPVLRALLDMENTVLDALDELVDARLLSHSDESGIRYEFVHALVRHSVYGDLSASRQARLHRRIAQALERVHADDVEAHSAELANQYARSAALPGAERGLTHALAAAEQAAERHGHEQAATFLQLARRLGGSPALQAEILCRLTLAQARAMQVDQAQETLRTALVELAAAGSDPETMAAFLAEAALVLRDGGAIQEAVEALVEPVLALLGDRRELTWARLKLTIIPVERIDAGPIVAGRWTDWDPEAVTIARASGDELDFTRTIGVWQLRTRDELLELERIAEGFRNPAAKLPLLSVVMRVLLVRHGDVSGCRRVGRWLLEEAEGNGALPWQAMALAYLADTRAAVGEFGEAAELEQRAYRLIERLGSGAGVRQSVHAFRQPTEPDWAEVARVHAERARDPRIPGRNGLWNAAAAAYAYARAGSVEDAREHAGYVTSALPLVPPTEYQLDGIVGLVAAAAWELDAPELAPPLLPPMLHLAEAGIPGSWFTPTELAIARLESLLGRPDRALAWFDAARRRLEQQGQRPLLAVVDHDAALARVRARLPGARPLLLECAREFAALGMTGWLARAEALLESLGGRGRDGLTAREVEILRLVRDGRSNKEIGSMLGLSVRTVERHLVNVYAKLDLRNRSEATAYALRAEL